MRHLMASMTMFTDCLSSRIPRFLPSGTHKISPSVLLLLRRFLSRTFYMCPCDYRSLATIGVDRTPALAFHVTGCIELLHRSGTSIKGKRAVVIGRSNIVGMPAALMLQREDATVSMLHSRTKNPEEIARQADIIISAAGQPNLVRGDWIKAGSVIIDVGNKHVKDEKGERLVGDVCYEEACKIASAITPVPGGVGPMTIAMLLSNTLRSAKRFNNLLFSGGLHGPCWTLLAHTIG